MPIIDYCSTIWSTCKETQIYKVNKLQKRAARIILCAPFKTPSYCMFKQLSWLPIRTRFTYHIAIQVYKAINKLAPEYFCKLITISENSRYPLRSQQLHYLTNGKPQTQFLKKTFGYCGKNVWNALPLQIKQKGTLKQFRVALFQLLLSNLYEDKPSLTVHQSLLRRT